MNKKANNLTVVQNALHAFELSHFRTTSASLASCQFEDKWYRQFFNKARGSLRCSVDRFHFQNRLSTVDITVKKEEKESRNMFTFDTASQFCVVPPPAFWAACHLLMCARVWRSGVRTVSMAANATAWRLQIIYSSTLFFFVHLLPHQRRHCAPDGCD